VPKPVQDADSLNPKKHKCNGSEIELSITGDFLDDANKVELRETVAAVTWVSPAKIVRKEKHKLWFKSSCTRRGHPVFEDGDLSVTVTNGTGPTPQNYGVSYE
jgi:hypothetical protein